jgi:hypothetical protein
MGLLDFKPDLKFKTQIGTLADNIDLDRLFRAESSGKSGKTSSKGAYGLAQFLPSTWKGLEQDAKITGVTFPKELKGKKFKDVMDSDIFAKLAARTLMKSNEVYLKRLGVPVTEKSLLGAYNMGPTGFKKFIKDDPDKGFALFSNWNKN